MNIAFDIISNNIGMTFENWILLIIVLGGFLFYSSDVKIGLMIHILSTSVLFICLYGANQVYGASFNYVNSLVSVFIFIVILSLTLMPVQTTSKQGGFI
jgi:hypothetical protein